MQGLAGGVWGLEKMAGVSLAALGFLRLDVLGRPAGLRVVNEVVLGCSVESKSRYSVSGSRINYYMPEQK